MKDNLMFHGRTSGQDNFRETQIGIVQSVMTEPFGSPERENFFFSGFLAQFEVRVLNQELFKCLPDIACPESMNL